MIVRGKVNERYPISIWRFGSSLIKWARTIWGLARSPDSFNQPHPCLAKLGKEQELYITVLAILGRGSSCSNIKVSDDILVRWFDRSPIAKKGFGITICERHAPSWVDLSFEAFL